MTYDPAKEGAILALREQSLNLGAEACKLGEDCDLTDVGIQDVSDHIENWQAALKHYRSLHPIDTDKEPR